MDSLSYRTGDQARLGGVDVTISLTPDEAAALGPELDMLADWFDSALWALALLRNGSNSRNVDRGASADVTARAFYTVINDVDTRLLPRLQGVRDAAIRRQAELGGSLGDLALAMDVSKSTAQSRRKAVLEGRDRPSQWENWATKGGPQGRSICTACGRPALPSDQLVTTAAEGYRIHRSHTEDPKSGFHGAALAQD
ncbi:hypothetical protein ACWEP8_39815 [Streptomyces hydrogenans]|uniref:hypothetical protein n=1 Tax=Streptomyces sp. NPDC048659 TaxID=3155489 RepID=UPI00341CB1DA